VTRIARILNAMILLLASLLGGVAFVYPFFSATLVQSVTAFDAGVREAPLITMALIVLCLGALLATLGSGAMNSKTVAILGALTAANAVLRAVPGPAGFAAVFVLPVLCGYVYGSTFGFLLGALSILVSALIGAGVGPWLPYQMLGAGWVGLTSGWLPRIERHRRVEVAMLGAWGLLWGFLFGALMNIWFWPYLFQPAQADLYWQPGMSLGQALRHYGAFYLLTSFWWDVGRAGGNALLTWLFGASLLRLLRRFQQRFHFSVTSSSR
jgi:energy-coupling factor transport system substrate-specific component